MNEFICPNGRMSVNGVCPIFEGDDGQLKDIQKDAGGPFNWDFDNPTESALESADNIISNNINAYNSFVENKLGISPIASNLFTAGSVIATGSLMPIVGKLATGAFLNYQNQQRVR